MIGSVAWVVPTHEPRFDFYRSYLRTMRQYVSGVETVVVLSRREEVELISANSGVAPDRVIALEDHFSPDAIEFFIRTRSVINVKKLLAVKLLEKSHSHIVVTDSEVQIYAKLTAEEIINRRTFFPFHRVENAYLDRVIAAPVGLVKSSQADRKKLMENFVYPRLYGWFADLPIYETARLEGFWSRYGLESLDGFYSLNFETFDYIMYQYHVALDSPGDSTWRSYDWDFKTYGGSCWELGYLNEAGSSYLKQDATLRNPLWISHKELVDLVPSAKILFNTDRDYTPVKQSAVVRAARYAKRFLEK